jgi:hypothetical protein
MSALPPKADIAERWRIAAAVPFVSSWHKADMAIRDEAVGVGAVSHGAAGRMKPTLRALSQIKRQVSARPALPPRLRQGKL